MGPVPVVKITAPKVARMKQSHGRRTFLEATVAACCTLPSRSSMPAVGVGPIKSRGNTKKASISHEVGDPPAARVRSACSRSAVAGTFSARTATHEQPACFTRSRRASARHGAP